MHTSTFDFMHEYRIFSIDKLVLKFIPMIDSDERLHPAV